MSTESGAEHFPDLIPSGDPEQDLTQLVCLIEDSLAKLEGEQAFPHAAVVEAWRDVTTFAKHLRGAWDDGLETGDGRS